MKYIKRSDKNVNNQTNCQQTQIGQGERIF